MSDDSDDFSASLIQAYRHSQEDPKERNERTPAWRFVHHFADWQQPKISRYQENPADPPDFWLDINSSKIALEVTTLAEKFVLEHNQFFRSIEIILRSQIEKHLNILPLGFYQFSFFPGELQDTSMEGFRIDVANFKFKASLSKVENQLETAIPILFANYSESSNVIRITNSNNQLIGEIRVSDSPSPDRHYMIQPQGVHRLKAWELEEFNIAIQKIIDNKEKKYSQINKRTDWWLLISDSENDARSGHRKFEFEEIRITTNFFDRIFLLQSAIQNNRIIEFVK